MKNILINTFLICGSAGAVFAQNVGISEAAPNSKLDVVQTQTTGNTVEVTHGITTNASSALWIKNSGTGRAINAQNLLGTNASHVGYFSQVGTGGGIYALMPAGNASIGATIDHSGSGYGVAVVQLGTGVGIINDVTANYGQINVIRSNNIGLINALNTLGGIGTYEDLGVRNGSGVYVLAVDNPTTPTAGGNVYAFNAAVRTATATAGTTVYGAVLAGNQYGLGHGVLVNHSGASGRNAEFNITSTTNTDAAVFSTHSGRGSAFLGQNQNNTLPAVIRVADFSYTGTNAQNHIGVYGYSSPAANNGIGVQGTGGKYGVYGVQNSAGATNYGVFATGNFGATGTKTFLIDLPSDPQNKMLRHFSMESDEILNMYRGNVMLDGNGKAIVELPDYFESININFSYQLTAIGTPVHPYILSEINGNVFEISGEPNTKVSWTVMAERNDPFVVQNLDLKENVIEKEASDKGKYLMPELYGQPASLGVNYSPTPTSQSSSSLNPEDSPTQEKVEEIRGISNSNVVKRPVIEE